MNSFKDYLAEAPYLNKEIFKYPFTGIEYRSDATLERDYTNFLLSKNTNLGKVDVYQHREKRLVRGFVKDKN